MRIYFLFGCIPLLFSTSTLAATDSEIVTEMAMQCWTVPEGANYTKASATFEVTYNADGELQQIATVEYQPVRQAGKQFAISAQNALLECANKTHIKSRTIRVVIKYTAPPSNGILIMKK